MGDKGFFLVLSDDLVVIVVKRRNCGEGCRPRGPGKPASRGQQDPVKAALTASSVPPYLQVSSAAIMDLVASGRP